MLTNNKLTEVKHVKFISYTGKEPNLCNGILKLEIDGNEYTFGSDYNQKDHPESDYPKFWRSSGQLVHYDNYKWLVVKGEWEINVDKLPKQFRKYAVEIDIVINDNIEQGCCGGCCN